MVASKVSQFKNKNGKTIVITFADVGLENPTIKERAEATAKIQQLRKDAANGDDAAKEAIGGYVDRSLNRGKEKGNAEREKSPAQIPSKKTRTQSQQQRIDSVLASGEVTSLNLAKAVIGDAIFVSTKMENKAIEVIGKEGLSPYTGNKRNDKSWAQVAADRNLAKASPERIKKEIRKRERQVKSIQEKSYLGTKSQPLMSGSRAAKTTRATRKSDAAKKVNSIKQEIKSLEKALSDNQKTSRALKFASEKGITVAPATPAIGKNLSLKNSIAKKTKQNLVEVKSSPFTVKGSQRERITLQSEDGKRKYSVVKYEDGSYSDLLKIN